MRVKVPIEADVIEIIDALAESDLHTADRVHDHIKDIQYAENAAQCTVHKTSVRTARELTDLLDEVSARVGDEDIRPVLHIECHGTTSELTIGNGSVVDWAHLSPYFRRLNRAARNKLLIVIGACEAFNGIKTMADSIEEGAAFRVLVGPTERVGAGNLEDSLKRFYDALLTDRGLAAALDAARHKEPSLRAYSAEHAYVRAWQDALQESTQETKKQRVEKLVTEALTEYPDLAGVGGLHRAARQALADDTINRVFESTKRKFFMIDEFPEIENEVKCLTLEAVEAMANS